MDVRELQTIGYIGTLARGLLSTLFILLVAGTPHATANDNAAANKLFVETVQYSRGRPQCNRPKLLDCMNKP
jgi:hypothetical protein